MSKKVLYLHVSSELYGSDLIVFQLVTNLDRSRYEPIVVLPSEGSLGEKLKKESIPVKIMPLAVLRRRLFNPQGILKFSITLIESIYRLTRLIRDNKIDIVHTNTSATWSGGISAKLCGVPHLFSVMEIVGEPKIVSLAMAWMTTLFSDRAITVSEAVANHFKKLCPLRTKIYQPLFPPVDLKRFVFDQEARVFIRKSLGIDDQTVVVGMAGRLNHWKGQDVFIRACKKALELVENRKKLHFFVLGGPVPEKEEFERELHRDIEEFGLSSVVTAPGFKENISQWMSAMDIFVLPSKLPEPSSTGVVSAMAIGLPVVGTNIGGTPETVVDGKTGFLVPPNDPKTLAEKIAILSLEDDLRTTMGKNASERAKKLYSIEHYVKEIMKVYDELV